VTIREFSSEDRVARDLIFVWRFIRLFWLCS
jgi:hypothetical protein